MLGHENLAKNLPTRRGARPVGDHCDSVEKGPVFNGLVLFCKSGIEAFRLRHSHVTSGRAWLASAPSFLRRRSYEPVLPCVRVSSMLLSNYIVRPTNSFFCVRLHVTTLPREEKNVQTWRIFLRYKRGPKDTWHELGSGRWKYQRRSLFANHRAIANV